jgi:hypothetical protein
MRMPGSIEEVSAEWLSEALSQNYPGVVVERADQEIVRRGTSTLLRERIRYNDAGRGFGLPSSVIVKGGFEEHSSQMGELYLREMRFYRDLAPLMPIRAPICYFADAGADFANSQSQCLIIMEDLAARGVDFCHPFKTQTYDQVSRRLDAMAAYHAAMWEHSGFIPGGSLDWLEPNIGSAWLVAYLQIYADPRAWEACLARPSNVSLPNQFRDFGWYASALGKLSTEYAASPKTVCHGDTHLGNLYIESDGTPGFYDAFPSRSPWFYEVTYHIICALDIGERRLWEKPLLAHYLMALRRHGIDSAPTLNDAWEHYIRSIAWGLFVFAVNEPIFQSHAINGAYVVRFADAALCHETYRLLR